jgi:hypothetical protein
MLYFIVALLCFIRLGRPHRRFWWPIALLLLVLGLSRLANFEQIVTDLGRQMAMSYGWYNTRRPIQSIGIFGMIVLGSGGIVTYMLTRFRRLRAPETIGSLGVGCLLTLISVRLISLHSVDNILDRHVEGVRSDHLPRC